MWWMIKYEGYDYDVNEYITMEITKDNWHEVVKFFISCVEEADCHFCEVTCMWGGVPYGDNPVVLSYQV